MLWQTTIYGKDYKCIGEKNVKLWQGPYINPYKAELFVFKPWRLKGFFNWNTSTYVIGLLTLEILSFFPCGDRDDPRTKRII